MERVGKYICVKRFLKNLRILFKKGTVEKENWILKVVKCHFLVRNFQIQLRKMYGHASLHHRYMRVGVFAYRLNTVIYMKTKLAGIVVDGLVPFLRESAEKWDMI